MPLPTRPPAACFDKLRAIRKRNAGVKITATTFRLIDMIKKIEAGELENAEANRRPVWTDNKGSLYIRSLLESTAPTDFLARNTTKEDDDGYPMEVDEVYDGGNRMNAVLKFYQGKICITDDDRRQVNYASLPRQEKNALDRVQVQFNILHGCTDTHACDMASKRNEGTPMAMGEKLNLLMFKGTPRAQVLYDIMKTHAFLDQGNDRAVGLKVMAQVIASFESERKDCVVDYHMPELTRFYEAENLRFTHFQECTLNDGLTAISLLCGENGKPPAEIVELMTLEKSNASVTAKKTLAFYCTCAVSLWMYTKHNKAISLASFLHIFKMMDPLVAKPGSHYCKVINEVIEKEANRA